MSATGDDAVTVAVPSGRGARPPRGHAPHPGLTRRQLRVAGILLLVYLVLLTLVAVWPTPVDRPVDSDLQRFILAAQRAGFFFVRYGTIEFAANVLLFVPFGVLFGAVLGRSRRWIGVPVCLAVSLTIEFVQQEFLPGRDGDPRDLLANTVGAAVGVAIVAVAAALRRRRVRRAGTSGPS